MALPDWQSIILSTAFFHRLERMAEKRFPQPALADTAVTEIIEQLSADNWQKLSGYSGNSQPETYAHTVSARLLEDFSRSRFGRPRPPKWLQAEGAAWILVWRMLCLERQWPDLVKARLEADHEPGFVANIITTIRARIPRCGEPGYCEQAESESGLENSPAHAESLDNQLIQQQRTAVLAALSSLLDSGNSPECPSNMENAWSLLEGRLALSGEDRLLLALIHEDGLSTRKAASVLGSNPSAVQRRLTDINRVLRGVLQDWGVDSATALTEARHDA